MLSSEIRVPMPASRQHVHDSECHQKVLPNSLLELTSVSDETIKKKLNEVDSTQDQSDINCGSRKTCNTRPLSAQIEVVEDIDTLKH